MERLGNDTDSEDEEDSDQEDQICLMADHTDMNEVCLISKKKSDMWYLDSGCSRHMTGKTAFFIKLNKYDGGFVTFGDDGKCEIIVIDFANLMTSEFDMSMMGELTFFFGLQIKQTVEGIFVHQEKYAKKLFKKFGLKCAKPMGTPMHPNIKLDKDEHARDMDETRYRKMIGFLMFLNSSRPDIIQSVGICSRFQSKPK
ncbi:uncharacterized mitochondrial protein AtMg00810-like [Arachis stenosperma]|uniref:uncharacterized mitochondrial protein AtMg00810-like n=1 Tax=Arachis stenosperma TaxID=217475 RepID=UPI0025ABAA5F|nr:uncharacterized mitochondrial protein AtMg00810-like [Arachis stenosperma]